MQTPVVFLIFKRADATETVFEAIRQAKPSQLFVIADGPRADRPGEAEKCAETRAIIDRVDWDCQVFKNYADQNLGCAKRVSSGLNWVFDQVEEAIILEDDCVPHPSFFPFCEDLLDRHRTDQRIFSISGQNVQFGRRRTEYSYYFSRFCHCWGWATWKRAWRYFDFDMTLWEEVKTRDFLRDLLVDPRAVKTWTNTFQATYDRRIDSWANRWMFACWTQNGINILANRNLVSNIGFGTESTNTGNRVSRFANMPREAIEHPLQHPPFVMVDREADTLTQNTLYSQSLLQRARAKLRKSLLRMG
ncbi:glycosyltransferase family 2 protein [Oculatella sp. LEGE 06141]|uniref:glycosyltransferase family 2 protein n=1 Tax=Oculatella sp. LEGE 06141 TaxID=1828648 RepID=UPI001881E9EA|nr:glycosyltransferase family 2 protein [Oculatella sp. LEGE 06141]MBE9179724.1 glycosyltransferase family 2 protein [Oculatella sp. LEGE 06141]